MKLFQSLYNKKGSPIELPFLLVGKVNNQSFIKSGKLWKCYFLR